MRLETVEPSNLLLISILLFYLLAGNGQKRHHFHGFARNDREVRMAFEHLRSGFMGSSAHYHENGQLIGNVRHAVSRSVLGFAKRPALPSPPGDQPPDFDLARAIASLISRSASALSPQ